jgi:hypothetical protein
MQQYREGNGRDESAGRRLDGQRTVENFGNRKVLKGATNRMMIMLMLMLLLMMMQDLNRRD